MVERNDEATPGGARRGGGGRGRRRRARRRRPCGAGHHGECGRLGPTPGVTWAKGGRDGSNPTPAGRAVSTRLEDVRSVGQVEWANILSDRGASSVVVHLEGRQNPTLAVSTVGATSAEALPESFRVGELVLEVQERPEDGRRLRVATSGVDTDVGRPDGASLVEETRGVAPQDPMGAEGL